MNSRDVESALGAGVGAYFFIGLLLGMMWTLDIARHPYGRDMDPWLLVQGVFILAMIWPYIIVQHFDNEDRWGR